MDAIIEGLVEAVPRTIGWAVLKIVTFGRYRGFGTNDLLVEGGVGLAALAGLCYVAYAWWPR